VYGWQIASVDCYHDGTVLGSGYRHDPAPTLELIDNCLLVTGGGDPVRATTAMASCTSSLSTVTCSDGADRCFAQSAPFGPEATPVSVTWSGGDLGSGMSARSLPPVISFGLAPIEIVRGQPYSVSFSGGNATGKVQLLAAVPHKGSTMIVDCVTSADAGQLVIPSAVAAALEPGQVNLLLKDATLDRAFAGDFRIDARVNGPTVGDTELEIIVR